MENITKKNNYVPQSDCRHYSWIAQFKKLYRKFLTWRMKAFWYLAWCFRISIFSRPDVITFSYLSELFLHDIYVFFTCSQLINNSLLFLKARSEKKKKKKKRTAYSTVLAGISKRLQPRKLLDISLSAITMYVSTLWPGTLWWV